MRIKLPMADGRWPIGKLRPHGVCQIINRQSAIANAFTLVEVMVAIVILAIGLTGLTHGISLALASSKESELQTTAALFASGQVELLRAEGGLTDGEENGDCGAALPLYRWKQTIAPTDVDGLHDVTVTVESAQSGSEIYELKTLLFEIPADTTDKTKSKNTNKNRS